MLLKLATRALNCAFAGVTVCTNGMPRLSYNKRAAIKQAIELQRVCYTGTQLLDGDLRGAADKEARARVAVAIGSLVKNWTVLAEAIRVLRNIPAPGSLRPEPKIQRSNRRRVEPVDGPLDLEPLPLRPA